MASSFSSGGGETREGRKEVRLREFGGAKKKRRSSKEMQGPLDIATSQARAKRFFFAVTAILLQHLGGGS